MVKRKGKKSGEKEDEDDEDMSTLPSIDRDVQYLGDAMSNVVAAMESSNDDANKIAAATALQNNRNEEYAQEATNFLLTIMRGK